MLPRCTGMCGALATRLPSPSKTAQEKSSRSLMLTDCAVSRSASPICSAIAMKRLLNTSSSTGSAAVPQRFARVAARARQHEIVARRDLGTPAVLDHDRLMRLDDERGTGERTASIARRSARRHRRLVPRATRVKCVASMAVARRRVERKETTSRSGVAAAARRLDLDVRGKDALLRRDEAEPLLCAASKSRTHEVGLGKRHRQRRVRRPRSAGAGARDRDVVVRHALIEQLLGHRVAERPGPALDLAHGSVVERHLDRLLAARAQAREPDAVGREQARERMDEHRLDAERVGDEARVLAARRAEAVERIARHVVAALDRDLLDGVRHVLDRDADEAVGDRFRRAPVADPRREAPRRPARTAASSIGSSRPARTPPERIAA